VIRIALLGTAHVHVGDYLAAIAKDPGTRLVAVHGGDVPGVRRVHDVRQALRDADMALVTSTTAEHNDVLRHTALARVPVLVEKPLAGDLPETVRLVPLLASGGTTAMFLRCAPAFRRVRSLLAGGELGELAVAHLRFTHPGLLDGVFTGPAAWMRHVGGFTDLAVHLFDLLLWLRPRARLALRATSWQEDAGGAALLDWGGFPATVHAGWTSRPGGIHLHIEGSRDSVTVDGGRLMMNGHTETHDPPRAEAAFEAFVGALRGHARWEPPSTADIIAVAGLIDEARQSPAR